MNEQPPPRALDDSFLPSGIHVKRALFKKSPVKRAPEKSIVILKKATYTRTYPVIGPPLVSRAAVAVMVLVCQ